MSGVPNVDNGNSSSQFEPASPFHLSEKKAREANAESYYDEINALRSNPTLREARLLMSRIEPTAREDGSIGPSEVELRVKGMDAPGVTNAIKQAANDVTINFLASVQQNGVEAINLGTEKPGDLEWALGEGLKAEVIKKEEATQMQNGLAERFKVDVLDRARLHGFSSVEDTLRELDKSTLLGGHEKKVIKLIVIDSAVRDVLVTIEADDYNLAKEYFIQLRESSALVSEDDQRNVTSIFAQGIYLSRILGRLYSDNLRAAEAKAEIDTLRSSGILDPQVEAALTDEVERGIADKMFEYCTYEKGKYGEPKQMLGKCIQSGLITDDGGNKVNALARERVVNKAVSSVLEAINSSVTGSLTNCPALLLFSAAKYYGIIPEDQYEEVKLQVCLEAVRNRGGEQKYVFGRASIAMFLTRETYDRGLAGLEKGSE